MSKCSVGASEFEEPIKRYHISEFNLSVVALHFFTKKNLKNTWGKALQ